MNIGIDYGRGMANVDRKTGIRYGVISQNSVLQAWADSAEPEYDPAVEWDTMDEPTGWTLDDGEYKAVDCLDTEIMIIQSPYYTLAPFCSPCCPGAGNLDQAGDGVKTYCFGHEWFDGGRAPYPVYRVSDGSLVEP